jgi:CRISPR-associated protein Csh1
VYGAILNGYLQKAKHIFNLYYSIKIYDGKGVETMKKTPEEIKNALREKINEKETVGFSDSDEYYFAVGQLVSFFISKSKMTKKNHSLANPFLQAKTDAVIKKKLRDFYIKYNYTISYWWKKFNNMYAMVAIYEPEGKINTDMIIAGYLCDNLILEKDGDENNENGKEEE